MVKVFYTSRIEVFGTYEFNKEFSFQFSFNDHNQNSVYGTTLFKADQTIGFGQFIWNKTIKKNDFLVGLAYRYTFYDDDTTADSLNPQNAPSKSWLPGVFIQDELKFNDKHKLLLGLRYDQNSLHGSIFTPRIGYKWMINPSTIFRINTGTGYRVVNIFTEDHAALTGAREVVISDNIDPEQSYNGNINFNKSIVTKKNKYIEFDASVFRTNFSNKIVPNYDTDPNFHYL